MTACVGDRLDSTRSILHEDMGGIRADGIHPINWNTRVAGIQCY